MKIAAVQMVSGMDVTENMRMAERLIVEACNAGAELVLLPEYWPLLGQDDLAKLAIAEVIGDGPLQKFMAEQAAHNGIYLIGGTIPLATESGDKVFNSCLVYGPAGELLTRYDKVHLFSFTKGQETYDEAQSIVAGEQIGFVDLPFGRVGLSVCYDLRFPEFYRAMGECALIVVPAAFTYTTGKAHWELLLRARAVENQCFVLAAGQGGRHQNGRSTWGHSMVIDPWGEVLAVQPEGEGVALADWDAGRLVEVRASLPALKHRKC